MSISPERGATVFKVGAVLAAGAGSLALAGSAKPSDAEAKPKTPKRNMLMVDHLAEIAMLDHTMPIILKREDLAEDKITYHMPFASTNHSSTHPYNVHFSTARSKWLRILRDCESSDNYSDNTGNGFYGAYQFLLSTWRRLGYKGLPSEASPIVQDEAIIRNTDLSKGGLETQNPGCYESTGISAKPPA